jgi:benzoyl-CoA reductase/2-hydroxyglutaryl-CoA dehydratase subunit BcrC/BadD/HgdB
MARDMHEELLRLAGFEESELPEFLPQWRKAAEKIGLTEADVRFGVEEWIPTHFDIRLEGVRKGIGGWLREVMDLMKADEYRRKGCKLLYGVFPSGFQYFYSFKVAAPEKTFVSVPDAFMSFVLNMLFHKLDPYMDEAEREGISRACRHCPASKWRYAARRWGVIPTPDVSWVWGFLCDNAPKADEFIQAYHDADWKTVFTRLPHDEAFSLAPEQEPEPWRVEYLAGEMKESFHAVQKELGISVSDEQLYEADTIMKNYAVKLAKVAGFLASDPQPVGGVSTELFSFAVVLPFNTGLEYMDKALNILIKELEQRVANKEGILPEGAPKLMAWTAPAGVPWVVKTFEENGVRFQRPMSHRRRPAEQKTRDPFIITAEDHLRGGNNTGSEALQVLEDLKNYQADGMVFGFYDFDRWLGGHHRLLARIVEEKTGLPTFYIEGNSWDDRDYSAEALRTRIESICEIMKMRKG